MTRQSLQTGVGVLAILAVAALAGCSADGSAAASGAAASAPGQPIPGGAGGGDGVGVGGTGGASGGQPSAAGTGGIAVDPVVGAPASGLMRRLSPVQYARAMADLLGPLAAVPEIEDSPSGDSLKAIAASITAVTPLGVERFETAAMAAVGQVFADAARRDALVGCAVSTAWDATCAGNFIRTLGRRAWRRALSEEEVARYLAVGTDVMTTTGLPADGLRAIAMGLLQSPNFVYRVELGSGAPVSRFTGFELAGRLSFLFWGTTPDDELLAAAEGGMLDTAEGVQGQVLRLLASPRRVDGLNDMVDDLFALDQVYLMSKDESVFPGLLTLSLRDAMREEVLRQFQDVAQRDVDVFELFDTNRTFVNAELAALYGITGVTGDAFVEALHPAQAPRAGILTSAALLTVQDKRHETSPTRRGAYVRRVLTCDAIPSPPADVITVIPEPPAGTIVSRRDLLSSHVTDPSCSGCHSLMDPIGLSFENFDAMGRFRTNEENGLLIDASGEIDGQPYAGPQQLGTILKASEKARNCLVRRVYRYTTGHTEGAFDNLQITNLGQSFTAQGQRLNALLLGLAQSEGFLNVSLPPQ